MFGLNQIIGAVLVAGAISGFVAFAAYERNKGAASAVAKMERKADVNARKADAARRSADQLPVDGLRDAYFRD